jgi:esterase FrsA
MAYQWPLDPQDLFEDRHPQMIATGLPPDDIEAVRAAVREMWPDRPGGWVHEWSQRAAQYAADGRHDLAALAYGWAKFPCLADDAKRAALHGQLQQYQLAAPGFGVELRRQILDVPHLGGTTPVPVHLLAPADLPDDAPVLLASGGVDTWKMDLHPMFVILAQHLRARVMAFDIAGTGESAVPMTPDGGTEIVRGLIAHARSLTDGRVAHIGFSMGGYFSAWSGLTGAVDAAVDLGGPVDAAFTQLVRAPAGMGGIVGNALGFDHAPAPEKIEERLSAFSLRPLLDQDTNAPMLVVNGADDVLVPQRDTLVFEGRPDTQVHILSGAGHCGKGKVPETSGLVLTWLQAALGVEAQG